jgi:hypothetical protein
MRDSCPGRLETTAEGRPWSSVRAHIDAADDGLVTVGLPSNLETRFPEWEIYGSDVMLRFRTRFQRDLIFTEMVAIASNSLETVRAAVAADVPKPLLPDPWPPYPVSDILDSKRLGALKMKLSIGISGVENLSSSELLGLIDARFPERVAASRPWLRCQTQQS